MICPDTDRADSQATDRLGHRVLLSEAPAHAAACAAIAWTGDGGEEVSEPGDTATTDKTPQHKRAGWWAAGGVALAVALIIGATAGGWFSQGAGTVSAPGLLSQGSYEPRDQQQSDSCDGLPAVEPTDLRLLDPQASVRSGVICLDSVRLRPGDGRWTMRDVHEIPVAALPGLIDALTMPDHDRGGACTLQLILVPGFVLTLDDGTRIRPGLPGDGCHVNSEAPFDALSAGPVLTSVPVAQVSTELEVITGCQPESKPPADWLDSPSSFPVSDFVPITPEAQQISLCLFSAGQSNDERQLASGPLVATGTVSANVVNEALAHLSEVPAAQCSDPPPRGTAAATAWLLVQPQPQQAEDDPPAPLLAIETDACRRVVDAQKMTPLGYLSPAGAEALAAAADQPAG